MSKKTMLEKHIKEMRGRLARLRENTTESKTPKSVGLARLIETEIDKTESVINARAITSKLQDMAEDVVNLQGKQLFQMLEKMKEAFGPEFTEQFKTTAQQTLNTLMEQIGQAKDALDNQVLQMENIINGQPANDMATDDGSAMADVPMPGDDTAPPDAEAGSEPDSSEGEIGADLPGSEDDGEEQSPMDLDSALGNLGAPDEANAAGRARKESFVSDKAVLEAFRTVVREGNKPSKAARIVAENFDIDAEDVRAIVLEFDMKPTPESKRGMFKGKTKADIKTQHAATKRAMQRYEDDGKPVPKKLRTKSSEETFALRAKSDWGKVDEEATSEGFTGALAGAALAAAAHSPANTPKQVVDLGVQQHQIELKAPEKKTISIKTPPKHTIYLTNKQRSINTPKR